MAGIPIADFVALGFSLAKGLVPDAFVPGCIVRLNPSPAVDPVEDTKVMNWGAEVTADLFFFDDEDEREQLPKDKRQRTFMLEAKDYPPGIPFNQNGQVETPAPDNVRWEIYRAEVAPGGSMVLFYGRA